MELVELEIVHVVVELEHLELVELDPDYVVVAEVQIAQIAGQPAATPESAETESGHVGMLAAPEMPAVVSATGTLI